MGGNPLSWGMVLLLIILGLVMWYCAWKVTRKPGDENPSSEESEEKDLAERIAEDPDNRHN